MASLGSILLCVLCHFPPRPPPPFSLKCLSCGDGAVVNQPTMIYLPFSPSSTTVLTGCPTALTDSEDESPEDMRLPPYGLCERGDPSSSSTGLHEASPLVIISQPAPIAPHLSGPAEDNSSDSVREGQRDQVDGPRAEGPDLSRNTTPDPV